MSATLRSATLGWETKRERERRLEHERKSLGMFAPRESKIFTSSPSKLFVTQKSIFDGIINR